MVEQFVKQHIVPQRYLQRFAAHKTNGAGYYIGVRKVKGHDVLLYKQSISNVAFVRNIYDDKLKSDPKHWEHLFSRQYEPLYGKPIDRVCSKALLSTSGSKILTDDEKHLIGKLIAVQYMRVPSFLYRQQKTGNQIGADIAKEVRMKFGEKLPKDKRHAVDRICYNPNSIKSIMMSLTTDQNRINAYADLIADHVMTVVYNNTAIPFFTSDNPVILYNLYKGSMDYDDCGMARADTIIFYPLSSKVLIQAFPRAMLTNKGIRSDCERIVINSDETGYLIVVNGLQFRHAWQESFCPPDFIDLVKQQQTML